MFPTCDVELVRSMYSSSRRPFSIRAIRHSSPSETLISISFAMQYSVVDHPCPRIPESAKLCYGTVRAPATGNVFLLLKSLWDELPRLFAEIVHHLSFAVEAHHLARYFARVVHAGGADDLFDLRNVRAIHAERVQPEP